MPRPKPTKVGRKLRGEVTPVLTPRQLDVVKRIVFHGDSHKEIAFWCGLTENTVGKYITDIHKRLNCQTRFGLLLWASHNRHLLRKHPTPFALDFWLDKRVELSLNFWSISVVEVLRGLK